MTTTFLLIRHASHDWLGKGLAGRMEAVHLNARGQREAAVLAQRLPCAALDLVCVSPRERARETAAPLAQRYLVKMQVDRALDEIDFGDWTGKSFDALKHEAEWRMWCERRSAAQPPGGETIGAAQSRLVQRMHALAERHSAATIALVTHGDVIKAGLAHFLALSLDDLERFDIAPASVSVVEMAPDRAQVRSVNAVFTASTTADQSPLRS